MGEIKIVDSGLYHIDLEGNKVETAAVSDVGNDVRAYLEVLLQQIRENSNNRMFRFASTTSEVRVAIDTSVSDSSLGENALTVAKRLLRSETAAQQKYQHITKIHRGSLFIALAEEDDSPVFLCAKIDHNSFLDESDLKKHVGLPFERQVLKACIIEAVSDDEWDAAIIYDTNTRLTEYWWRDFLELEEVTSDEQNTLKAFNAVDAVLGRRLKKKHPADHTVIRNNLVAYFRTSDSFTLSDCVDRLCGAYVPEDPTVDMAVLRQKIEALPAKKNFDSKFGIKPDVIKARCRHKITLTEKIDLMIKGHIPDLAGTIQGYEEHGVRYVRIRSDEGYKKFSKSTQGTTG